MRIRTAGDMRGFLADIMVGIRGGSVDSAQAHAIAKIAAQINQSLAVEVNTALQLERMGKDRPVAGSMLIGPAGEAPTPLPHPPAPEEADPYEADDKWAEAAVRHIEKLKSAETVGEFVSSHCDRLESLMEGRPELHAQITVAINEAYERLQPSELARIKESLREDLQWCDQCDMRVTPEELAGCKSRHCSLKGQQAA